jgi:hypothetical protein
MSEDKVRKKMGRPKNPNGRAIPAFVLLPPPVFKRIEDICNAEDKSMSHVLRTMVEEHFLRRGEAAYHA